jgi:ferredoxin--NADP+ reductase
MRSQADAPAEPGPDLPEVRMHLHMPANPGTGVVVANTRCTRPKASGFVRHVAIDVSSTQLAGNFRPGQSFGVIPPGVDAHGKPHKVRLYSICSPTHGEDGASKVVATTVKRSIFEDEESGRLRLGVASNFLCDLQPGDPVQVTGPSGKRFVLPSDPGAHDYLFFATGTGIAPFRGMVLDLLRAQVPSRIALVMGSAYATDLLYHEELRALAAEHPNFTCLTALSRERQEDGGKPMYVQDRLETHAGDLVRLLTGPRGLVYVCGVAGMELGVFQGLGRALPRESLPHYLRVDDAAGDARGWQRSMIQRQIRPTRRMFIEVY